MTYRLMESEGEETSKHEFKPRKCPECKSERLNKDYKRMELSCLACGYVLDQPVLRLQSPYFYQGYTIITDLQLYNRQASVDKGQ